MNSSLDVKVQKLRFLYSLWLAIRVLMLHDIQFQLCQNNRKYTGTMPQRKQSDELEQRVVGWVSEALNMLSGGSNPELIFAQFRTHIASLEDVRWWLRSGNVFREAFTRVGTYNKNWKCSPQVSLALERLKIQIIQSYITILRTVCSSASTSATG